MRLKTSILLFTLWLSVYAQSGLSVAQFFDGRFHKSEHAVVTLMKGKKLTPYNLSLFHSISLDNSPEEVKRIEKAVLNDKSKARQVELVSAENKIMACYLQLPPENPDSGPNRFILFRTPDNQKATLIYMEGDTDLDSLIKIFINKKK